MTTLLPGTTQPTTWDATTAATSFPNSTLIAAIVWIINQIYVKQRPDSLTFSLWSNTPAHDKFQTELLSEILTSLRDGELTYMIENRMSVECDSDVRTAQLKECLLRKNVILMVDSFDAFMLFKSQLMRRNFQLSGLYTIIYTGNELAYYEAIRKIFEQLFWIYLTNVNIFVELTHTRETLVFTYHPFTPHYCDRAYPFLLNRFRMESGFAFERPFFPRKTNNMHGCMIKVATWEAAPFIEFIKDPNGGAPQLGGIEGEILLLLAEKMNFSIEVSLAKSRGWVHTNFTVYPGAVKMVIDGEANLTINTFVFTDSSMKSMWATYSHLSYPIVVAVPRGSPLGPFERLIRPFRYIIWSCLISSLLISIMIIVVIKCLRRKSISDFVFGRLNYAPVMNLIEVLLGGSALQSPQRNFARYILIVWLLYTFILRTVYSSTLFIILQDSKSHSSFQSIEELLAKNFTLYCAINTVEVILHSLNPDKLVVFHGDAFNQLDALRDSEAKKAVVLLKPFLQLYNWNHRREAPIRTLPSSMVTAPLTMYMRKNSFLVRMINENLLRILSSGIPRKWDRFFLESDKTMARIKGSPRMLSVPLLSGLFMVYAVLLVFCGLVFALELWAVKSRFSHRFLLLNNFL